MSHPALINLVRVTTPTIEADARFKGHYANTLNLDEVKLVSPDGEPAAVPVATAPVVFDRRLPYFNGDVGYGTQVRRRPLMFNIDWIGSKARRVLERWMHNRATIYVAPGFGHSTLFAWRARQIVNTNEFPSGATASALMSGGGMKTYNDGKVLLWDDRRKMFVGPMPVADSNLLLDTPAGGGLAGITANTQNRWIPSYPKSSTEGVGGTTAGWEKWGTDSGDITFEYISSGFGHTSCLGALRVYVTNTTSSSRAVGSQNAFDPGSADYQGYTFTGSGQVTLTVWVNGRFGGDAKLTLSVAGGASEVLDLSGQIFDDWTPLQICHYEASWSGKIPSVAFSLSAASTPAESDFMIGPTMFVHSPSLRIPQSTHWSDSADGAAASSYDQITNVRYPGSGTMTLSFYVPEDFDQSFAVVGTRIGLIGGRLGVSLYESGGWKILFGSAFALTVDIPDGIVPGSINAISVSWGANAFRIVVNGKVAYETASFIPSNSIAGAAADVYIGRDSGGYGSAPVPMLTYRVDGDYPSTAEIQYLHAQLRDPGVTEVALIARGRTYRIKAIPMTARNSASGTQWIGTLALEQATYNPDQSDVTNKEGPDRAS